MEKLTAVSRRAGAVAVALAVLFVGVGCEQVGKARDSRTIHDDIRSGCAAAARGYGLAIQRAADGDMSAAAFAGVSDGFAGAIAVCRDILDDGRPPAPGDLEIIGGFAASVAAANAQGGN